MSDPDFDPPASEDRPIRDAATIVVLRDTNTDSPRVLMGQRGAAAAFMPSKYVFPGGAVDVLDAAIALAAPLDPATHARLASAPVTAAAPSPEAMAVAAIRELWEETGQVLGSAGEWVGAVPEDWAEFAARGLVPNARALTYLFRAITPPGRSRRFDARFFMLDAKHLRSDPDDFSLACDELSHLHWIALSEARGLDLPFITEVVLAEAEAVLRGQVGAEDGVPFFDNSDENSRFTRIA